MGFVVIVAVAVSASLVAAETLLRRHVIPTDPFDTARALFHGPGTAIAAFGDSRINDGITNQSALTNFAMPGDSLATVLGKLDVWLAHNPDGRAIVGIPPQQFSQARLNAGQGKMLDDFLSRDEPMFQILRPNHRRYLLSYLQVVIDDPGILLRDAEARQSEATNSQTFADKPADAQRAQAQIRSQHHTPVPGFRETQAALQLRQSLNKLKNVSTHICLVTMPVTKAYRQAVAPEPNFAAARRFITDIARETGVFYLDLWSDYPDHLFANADHLRTAGAEVITRDILAKCFMDRQTSGKPHGHQS